MEKTKCCAELSSHCQTVFLEPYVAKKVYIDPSAPKNGTGTIESPFNTWENVIKWTPNVAYLQKAGTTYAGNIEIYGRSNGTLTAPYYIGAYGTGDKPRIIPTDSDRDFCMRLNNCSGGMVVENLELHGLNRFGLEICLTSAYSAASNSASGFVVRNCDFYMKSTLATLPRSSKAATKAVNIYMPSGKQINDVTIENCTFHSESVCRDALDKFNHILINQYDTTFHGLTINGCKFNDLYGSAIRSFIHLPDGTNVLSEAEYIAARPTGVIIENNIFRNISVDALQLHTGIESTTEHPSRINRNTVLNSGSWGVGRVNTFQLTYLKNVEIAYNRIDDVKTNAPDGDAIILDCIRTNDGKLLIVEDCLVHHNIISRCNSGVAKSANSSGINIYRGKNNLLYSNWIYNCSNGISVAGAEDVLSSGNKVFNNTIMQCRFGVYLAQSDIANTEVFNNLLLYNTVGLRVATPAQTQITLTHNMFCGNYKAHDISNGHVVTDSRTLPDVLAVEPFSEKNGWVLSPGSPCIGAGRNLPEDNRIKMSEFGLNGMPANYPPTIGAWQLELPFLLEDAGRFTTDRITRAMAYKDGYLFLAGMEWLTVVDYRDPGNPKLHKTFSAPPVYSSQKLTVVTLLVVGNTLFTAARKSGNYTESGTIRSVITAYDISNMSEIKQYAKMVDWAYVDENTPAPSITVIDYFENGGRGYLACAGNMQAGGGFAVVEVTDPADMKKTAYIMNTDATPANQPHGVCCLPGNIAVVGNYNSMAIIRAIDVSDPANPVSGGFVNRITAGLSNTNAWWTKPISATRTVSAKGSGRNSMFPERIAHNGLAITDFSNPAAPMLVANVDTPRAYLPDLDIANADYPHVVVEPFEYGGRQFIAADSWEKGGVIYELIGDQLVCLGNIGPQTDFYGIRPILMATSASGEKLLFMADGPNPSSSTSIPVDMGKKVYCMRMIERP